MRLRAEPGLPERLPPSPTPDRRERRKQAVHLRDRKLRRRGAGTPLRNLEMRLISRRQSLLNLRYSSHASRSDGGTGSSSRCRSWHMTCNRSANGLQSVSLRSRGYFSVSSTGLPWRYSNHASMFRRGTATTTGSPGCRPSIPSFRHCCSSCVCLFLVEPLSASTTTTRNACRRRRIFSSSSGKRMRTHCSPDRLPSGSGHVKMSRLLKFR